MDRCALDNAHIRRDGSEEPGAIRQVGYPVLEGQQLPAVLHLLGQSLLYGQLEGAPGRLAGDDVQDPGNRQGSVLIVAN